MQPCWHEITADLYLLQLIDLFCVHAACFENTVVALYKYVVPKPKAECSKTEQLGVSFAAGYIAGVFCAVVSHPADNLVSKLNSTKGASIGSIVNEMGWCAHPLMIPSLQISAQLFIISHLEEHVGRHAKPCCLLMHVVSISSSFHISEKMLHAVLCCLPAHACCL